MLAAIRRCSRFTFSSGGISTSSNTTLTPTHVHSNRRFVRDGRFSSAFVSVDAPVKVVLAQEGQAGSVPSSAVQHPLSSTLYPLPFTESRGTSASTASRRRNESRYGIRSQSGPQSWSCLLYTSDAADD